jgi:hypothetical protein
MEKEKLIILQTKELKTKYDNTQEIAPVKLRTDSKSRILITDSIATSFINWIHSALHHPGYIRVYQSIKEIYSVKNLKHLLYISTSKCTECQTNKNYKTIKPRLSLPLSTETPWENISSDIYGPVSGPNYDEKLFVITFTDRCSRWNQFAVVKDITAQNHQQSF